MAFALIVVRNRPTAVGFTTKALEQVRSMRAASPPFFIAGHQHGELE
jgi:hypothetical protein